MVVTRRKFLMGSAAGASVILAGYGVHRKSGLTLQSAPFEFLERTTGLRREVWPIPERQSGWVKSVANPVINGIGDCFDMSVMNNGEFWMWFSWRPKGGIGHCRSTDGVHWVHNELSFAPEAGSWRARVNRPKVLKVGNRYWMWYTGQSQKSSSIGLAQSEDGLVWSDVKRTPVFVAAE